MKRYFNIKTEQGVETVDEVDSTDFKTRKEFLAELSRLKGEYNMVGMVVYTSQRCTNEWKNNK